MWKRRMFIRYRCTKGWLLSLEMSNIEIKIYAAETTPKQHRIGIDAAY